MEAGQVSEIVRSPFGLHLIKVEQRKQEVTQSLEEVRDEIASKVFEGRIEREKDTWYQQARRDAAIDIKLETTGEQ